MSALVIGINLILLIVWTAIDPLDVVTDVQQFVRCDGTSRTFQNAFIGVFAAYNVSLVLLGNFIVINNCNLTCRFVSIVQDEKHSIEFQ